MYLGGNERLWLVRKNFIKNSGIKAEQRTFKDTVEIILHGNTEGPIVFIQLSLFSDYHVAGSLHSLESNS